MNHNNENNDLTNDIETIKVKTVTRYLDWMQKKFKLNLYSKRSSTRTVQRGEIYYCHLGEGIGSEQNKTRPCVIIQNDNSNERSPNTIVAPITHTESGFFTVVKINPIKTENQKNIEGSVLLSNISTVSKARLGIKLGKVTKEDLRKIDIAILNSLSLNKKFNSLHNQIKDKDHRIEALTKKNNKYNQLIKEYKNKIKEYEEKLKIDNKLNLNETALDTIIEKK